MPTIKQKADHVKAARQNRNHGCHWPGCREQVPPAKWGCTRHWFMLPIGLRNKIWASYRINQENDQRPSRKYVQVALEVRRWIKENHPKRKRLKKAKVDEKTDTKC